MIKIINIEKYKLEKTRVALESIDGVKYKLPKKVFFHLKEAYNRANHKLDALFIITGKPGSGKSNLGKGMAGTWEEVFYDREFTLNKIHFSAEDVVKATNKQDNQTEAIDFDEAIQGGSSKDGISRIGHILRKALITKRNKKHLYIIIVDNIKELNDKILERCISWYHVRYIRENDGRYRKGVFKMFNSKQALKVYEDLKKKKYNVIEEHPWYKNNKYNYRCNNYDNIWFSEIDYDKKKAKYTNLLDSNSKNDNKLINQRNKLIYYLLNNGFKQQQIAQIVGLSRSSIRDIKSQMAAGSTI